MLLIAAVIMAVLGISTISGIFYYFSKGLPKLDKLSDYHPKTKTKVYSSDGELIGEFYVETER